MQAAPASKQEEDGDDDHSLVYHAHSGDEGYNLPLLFVLLVTLSVCFLGTLYQSISNHQNSYGSSYVAM
jgi:hypothetical protein